MRRQRAVEIILTRPVTGAELHGACRRVLLAANTDRTRLMAVHRAQSPGRALRSLRREVDRLVPIDVLTTHYPDTSGQVLLNIAFTHAMRSVISQAATARGQEPEDFLARIVVEAVQRDEQARIRHLTAQLQDLLVHHTPEAVLVCAARVLLDHQRPRPGSSCAADDRRRTNAHTTLWPFSTAELLLHTPTDEQAHAVDTFRAGHHMVLQAGAGTGKTSTLGLLAATTRHRGRYLAFNKDIADAAATRFPRSVQCRTAHATAFAAVGHRFARRLSSPRQPAWRIGHALGIGSPVRIGNHEISHRTLSHTVLRTVTRFCQSADESPAPYHVPVLRGLGTPNDQAQLAEAVMPYVRKAWKDLQNPEDGVVRFEHDHYLKMWALTKPKIEADFLLLDEAQDTNPVLEQVFAAQRGHAQLVMVGDSAQAIYGWRGARDVMTGFDATHLTLTRSFRFGPLLAEQANRWLAFTDAPIRLTGSDTISTKVGLVTSPDAVLCRTNIGAMTEVMRLLEAGRRVALSRGGQTLTALALAARDLKEGRRTSHPELVLFASWGELQEYAEYDPAGRDLQPFAELVDTHGPEAMIAAVDALTDEDKAEVTVSTAHKAKGREWLGVRIAEDFPPPPDSDELDDSGRPIPEPVSQTDARLAYVAVTRARDQLDLGGLAWIENQAAPVDGA